MKQAFQHGVREDGSSDRFGKTVQSAPEPRSEDDGPVFPRHPLQPSQGRRAQTHARVTSTGLTRARESPAKNLALGRINCYLVAMLQITNLTYRIGGRALLENASASIPDGHKVGVVGRNGTGKSTLLNLLTGELHNDGGSIEVSRGLRIGSVSQKMLSGPGTPIDFVLAADTERAALLREAETATEPLRIAEIHTRLADIGAAAAEARAASILAGLGFDTAMQARPIESFSGGWRMRVALGATLFAAPDLLLLDEPSNHLDLETRMWLESHLAAYRGTILLVSHDRYLLNSVVDSILHLHGEKLTLYRGDYDNFERVRSAKLELQQALHEKQAAARAHMQAFVDRFRYKASKARQAQSRLKALERMELVAAVREDDTIRFGFPSPEPLASPLITLHKVGVGYGGTPVLRGLNLTISADDRIALLGANGNGKTTFLKLIQGVLSPMGGEMVKSGKLRVGYFEQEQADAFNLDQTAFQHMAGVMRGAPEAKVRAHLGRFGFPQARAEVKIGKLSGGEKARLLFATITRDAPHILLLDEPTNHLDIEAREALIEALNDYEGAVLLVTHDPHLVELCAERLWLVADGGLRTFDGDIDDYRRSMLEERRAEKREARAVDTDKTSRKDERRNRAAERAALSDKRKAAREAEKRMEKLAAEKRRIEAKLADPALYDRPAAEVTDLQMRLAAIASGMAAEESVWLEAQEAIEGVEA